MSFSGEADAGRVLQQVIDALPHPVFVKDRQHRFVAFNEAFCELLGRRRDELLGKSDLDFFPAEQVQVFWAIDDRVFKTGEPDLNEEMITDQSGRLRAISTRKSLIGVDTGRPLLVGVILDVTQHREAEAQISYLAHHDVLTDLPNRALLKERLERDLLRLERTGETMAVLCLDLDRFKEVNDLFGHSAGDDLLRDVAMRLRENLRTYDTAARLGGDEFAVVLPGVESAEAARQIAERLVQRLSEPYQGRDFDARVGTSIGIAMYPGDAVDAENLMRCADIALYGAKNDGRARARLFSPEMDEQLRTRRQLETDLRAALAADDQLLLHYQPQFALESEELVGFEALVRWQHPLRGIIPPGEFVPIAEDTGLIVPLGTRVLRQACETALHWPASLTVSVNVSALQFKQRDLPCIVAAALRDTGLPPERLELEITETVLLKDTEGTLAILESLKMMGVRVAMDDFGTGYSSLGHLRRFPFDKIKIDRSFVEDLESPGDARAIVDAALGLGRSLSMTTTAEGVENLAQLERLGAMGCELVQGFYCGRPMPVAAVMDMLAEPESGLRLSAWVSAARRSEAASSAAAGHRAGEPRPRRIAPSEGASEMAEAWA
jgi:diguanylate cyclase (GGDEF)-like protein/PAS domain S-box-containing protein